MEYFGLIAFLIVLSYLDLPSQLKKLKREFKRMRKYEGYTRKGVSGMSKMLEDLKGKIV